MFIRIGQYLGQYSTINRESLAIRTNCTSLEYFFSKIQPWGSMLDGAVGLLAIFNVATSSLSCEIPKKPAIYKLS